MEYPGAYYHVLARGDRREAIFLDDSDRVMFLRTLGEACERCGWKVHAWVLMGNHYHWVLETPEANLVEGMRWFQNTYTRRFNVRHQLWGHLFGGRYKAVVVEYDSAKQRDYLATLLNYVHLNPLRAGLVKLGEGKGLLDYRWSSLSQGYAESPGKRVKWLETRAGFMLSGRPDTAKGRRQMVEDLEKRSISEAEEAGREVSVAGQTLNSTLQRGWYWGSQLFREKLVEKFAGRNEPEKQATKSMHGEEAAEGWIGKGMRDLGLKESELKRLAGSDLRKVAIAQVLKEKTNVRQRWVAERLSMGSATNVSQQLRRFKMIPRKQLPKELNLWLDAVNYL